MIRTWGMLMIGAAGRGAGKTKLACSVIERFASRREIVGVKVTTIEQSRDGCPRGGEGCGTCSSMEGRYYISEENDVTSGKDTSRMLAAGASRVLWLRVLREHMAEGARALLDVLGGDVVSVCESNSLRGIIEPDGFMIVREKGEPRYKPSAKAVADYADREAIFDGAGFDMSMDDISLVGDRWAVRASATAIILAGGASRRLGRDKSMLAIDGRPLIAYIVEQLSPYFNRVLVSCGDVSKYEFLGVEAVADEAAGRGPMMGIVSAMKSSANAVNFVVACDIPEIDIDFVQCMLRQCREYDAVIPMTGPSRYEPVFAVYNKTVLGPMEAMLASGRNKIMDALSGLRVKYVEARRAENINTMDDYEKYVKRRKDSAV